MNLFRRAKTGNLRSTKGLQGEVLMDSEKNTLVVMDGVTSGGHPLAKERHTLASHSDVSINNYTDGYFAEDGSVLTFNEALNKWVPATGGAGGSAHHYHFVSRTAARMDGGEINSGNEWSWTISQPIGTPSGDFGVNHESGAFSYLTDSIHNISPRDTWVRVTMSYSIHAQSGAFPSGLTGVWASLRTASGDSPFGIPGGGAKMHTFDMSGLNAWEPAGEDLGLNSAASFTDVFDLSLYNGMQFIPVIYVYNNTAYLDSASATNTWIARGTITINEIT